LCLFFHSLTLSFCICRLCYFIFYFHLPPTRFVWSYPVSSACHVLSLSLVQMCKFTFYFILWTMRRKKIVFLLFEIECEIKCIPHAIVGALMNLNFDLLWQAGVVYFQVDSDNFTCCSLMWAIFKCIYLYTHLIWCELWGEIEEFNRGNIVIWLS
jgi:hypothetical protein